MKEKTRNGKMDGGADKPLHVAHAALDCRTRREREADALRASPKRVGEEGDVKEGGEDLPSPEEIIRSVQQDVDAYFDANLGDLGGFEAGAFLAQAGCQRALELTTRDRSVPTMQDLVADYWAYDVCDAVDELTAQGLTGALPGQRRVFDAACWTRVYQSGRRKGD